MANPGLIKTLFAETAVPAYRIVAHGSKDYAVTLATLATDPLLGTSTMEGSTGAHEVDVVISGLPEVRFGGSVAAGDPLTSDTQGRAVKATVAGSRLIGFAYVSATEGVIAPYTHAPGILP
ncbi:MAG: DUF2190 family protein [Tenuifilaceae bacterium]|nr:DUF2190 family protein [Tenuifilaceae bacterium]